MVPVGAIIELEVLEVTVSGLEMRVVCSRAGHRGISDSDSDLHRMDSSSDNDGPDMPFMGPSDYDFSQQSTGRSDEH